MITPIRTVTPTDAEREIAIDALGYRGRHYSEIPGSFRYHVEDVAQALADQRARYEAVADELDGSRSAALDEGVRRGFNRGVQTAARRIRKVSRG